MPKKIDEYVSVFELKLFSKGRDALLSDLESHLVSSRELWSVVTPNPEQIVQAYQDQDFYRALEAATIRIPDGAFLVKASQFLGTIKNKPSLSQRIPGVEVVAGLVNIASAKGLSMLIVGGRGYQPWVVGEPVAMINGQPIHQLALPSSAKQDSFSAVWIPGYQNVAQQTPAETQTILESVKKLRPDIMLVALGAPWQEKWLMAHREHLEASGVKVAMVVGGAIDMLLGKVKRAPAWMQRANLEWLYRLIQEPWRWKRQLRFFKFAWITLRELEKE